MWTRWVRAFAVLSGTVLVHELAHAVAAWRMGGRVQEVAVGFGPRLLARRLGGTTISLRPLLVGGFAAIDVDALPPARRIPVLLAGPFANLLMGLLLLPRSVAPETLRAIAGPRPARMQLAGVVGAMALLLRAGDLSALRFLAAQINLSVGLANLLPLMPLDGGHLTLASMEAKGVPAARRDLYRHTTALLFFWLLVQVLISDLRRLKAPRGSALA
jgi:membrane-associated protease RseP (regulator of RpoE activity)